MDVSVSVSVSVSHCHSMVNNCSAVEGMNQCIGTGVGIDSDSDSNSESDSDANISHASITHSITHSPFRI